MLYLYKNYVSFFLCIFFSDKNWHCESFFDKNDSKNTVKLHQNLTLVEVSQVIGSQKNSHPFQSLLKLQIFAILAILIENLFRRKTPWGEGGVWKVCVCNAHCFCFFPRLFFFLFGFCFLHFFPTQVEALINSPSSPGEHSIGLPHCLWPLCRSLDLSDLSLTAIRVKVKFNKGNQWTFTGCIVSLKLTWSLNISFFCERTPWFLETWILVHVNFENLCCFQLTSTSLGMYRDSSTQGVTVCCTSWPTHWPVPRLLFAVHLGTPSFLRASCGDLENLSFMFYSHLWFVHF